MYRIINQTEKGEVEANLEYIRALTNYLPCLFFLHSQGWYFMENKDNNILQGGGGGGMCSLTSLWTQTTEHSENSKTLIPQSELTRVDCIHLYFTARAKTHDLLVCKLALYPTELPRSLPGVAQSRSSRLDKITGNHV